MMDECGSGVHAVAGDSCPCGLVVSDDGHLPAIRTELAECLELARRMTETAARMADDMRAIKACVMGDE